MTDNYNIFFSIIVPAFNVEKYIERAISSILNQDFQNFELVIVNDGSTDNTSAIIEKYAENHSKIIVINHVKNESLHIVRYDGVNAANGQYIIFLDGDDYFTSNALPILYDSIIKNPGFGFYEYGYLKQPSGTTVLPSYSGNDRFSAFFADGNNPEHTMWNKVYDSRLLKEAFLSMEKVYLNFCEDIYESIVISYFLRKSLKVDKIITNYVIGTGISTTYRDYNQTIDSLQSIKTGLNLIQRFLYQTGQNVNFDNLRYRLLRSMINRYVITQKNEEIQKKLYFVLPDYFGVNAVLEYWLRKEKELVNSFDYRIGRKILAPLRKIKCIICKICSLQ
jgi:glycosyltransferase involved in cell wall biosynthesis